MYALMAVHPGRVSVVYYTGSNRKTLEAEAARRNVRGEKAGSRVRFYVELMPYTRKEAR